jgi:MATE family multidrug resistance protein
MNLTLPNRYDFLPRFYRLVGVNILSSIVVPLAGLISTAFLGHLPEIHDLAGVALAAVLFNYIYFIFGVLRMGTIGVTAQAVGGDDREAMLLVGLRNSLIAFGIGGLILILQYPIREIWFALASATPEVKASGITYFNTRIWGAPAVLINYVLMGWLLGQEMSGKVLLMSVVGNAANIVLGYLFIIRWDWASTGAGVSQAVSQYLMLLVGLVWVSREIPLEELRSTVQKLWDWSAFRATLTLNGNIFVRSFLHMSTFVILMNLSTTMGTTTLAANSLLVEIIELSIFFLEGIALATQTLTGNFEGQSATERFIPLLQVAVGNSLLVGLTIPSAFVLFPQTLFGLLTNHVEITEQIEVYVPWLLLIMGCISISLMLDGYFAALARGHVLRNTSLIAVLLGFAPFALWAWHSHSNHILWLALSAFYGTKMVAIALQLLWTSTSDVEEDLETSIKSI